MAAVKRDHIQHAVVVGGGRGSRGDQIFLFFGPSLSLTLYCGLVLERKGGRKSSITHTGRRKKTLENPIITTTQTLFLGRGGKDEGGIEEERSSELCGEGAKTLRREREKKGRKKRKITLSAAVSEKTHFFFCVCVFGVEEEEARERERERGRERRMRCEGKRQRREKKRQRCFSSLRITVLFYSLPGIYVPNLML